MSDVSLWFTWNYVRVKKYVEKPNTKEMGATAAMELCLAVHYQGSGWIFRGDSGFGSVEKVKTLMLKGLYSIMLLKTAFKDFTSDLIEENELLHGQWTTCTIDNEGVKLQACQFCDLQTQKKLDLYLQNCHKWVPKSP